MVHEATKHAPEPPNRGYADLQEPAGQPVPLHPPHRLGVHLRCRRSVTLGPEAKASRSLRSLPDRESACVPASSTCPVDGPHRRDLFVHAPEAPQVDDSRRGLDADVLQQCGPFMARSLATQRASGEALEAVLLERSFVWPVSGRWDVWKWPTAGTGRSVRRGTRGPPGRVNGSLPRAGGVRRSRAPIQASGCRSAGCSPLFRTE